MRVRYADTDASGAVHHSAYLAYFEVARVEALRGLGFPVGGLEASGVFMPVVEARITYLRPARLDELARGDCAPREGRAGLVLVRLRGDARRAAARHWLDAHGGDRARDTGRPLQLPDWVRELLGGIREVGSSVREAAEHE